MKMIPRSNAIDHRRELASPAFVWTDLLPLNTFKHMSLCFASDLGLNRRPQCSQGSRVSSTGAAGAAGPPLAARIAACSCSLCCRHLAIFLGCSGLLAYNTTDERLHSARRILTLAAAVVSDLALNGFLLFTKTFLQILICFAYAVSLNVRWQ